MINQILLKVKASMPLTLQGAQCTLTSNRGCIHAPFYYWFIIEESIETPDPFSTPSLTTSLSPTIFPTFPPLPLRLPPRAATSKSCRSVDALSLVVTPMKMMVVARSWSSSQRTHPLLQEQGHGGARERCNCEC